jgi:thiol-disulfide isomerase/thioredoxin
MSGNVGLQARLLVFAVLGLWLSGCMEAKPPTPGTNPNDKTGKVELKMLSNEEILERIAAEKGKTVVVDVWASWCPPCKKEFPNLLVVDRDFSKQGVVCISVSIDKAEEHKAALAFLNKVGSTIPNYRALDKDDWLARFSLEYIPAILVFQDGKFIRKFDTYDELTPFLKEVVAKKTS